MMGIPWSESGLDCAVGAMDNHSMNNLDDTHLYTPEMRAMLDEAIHHALTGRGDPEILKRIHDEAEKIRAEIYAQHGALDVGVPAIRELRGGDGE
jgi:hypothetical protein